MTTHRAQGLTVDTSHLITGSGTTLSDDDRPVEASVMISPAETRRLRYEITP
ncbi:hypothetical protein [Promicromonospora sp. NPDC060271]|uniref:hypothetical protein n=1 Tax=Promicromonospora sp. NPDC060271 TaxID=3347089 RepID=UPI0036506525